MNLAVQKRAFFVAKILSFGDFWSAMVSRTDPPGDIRRNTWEHSTLSKIRDNNCAAADAH
jgi:hypothetical protein